MTTGLFLIQDRNTLGKNNCRPSDSQIRVLKLEPTRSLLELYFLEIALDMQPPLIQQKKMRICGKESQKKYILRTVKDSKVIEIF